MSIKINKNNKEYPLGVIPQHYPADRVYLDGNTSKTAQGAIDSLNYHKVAESASTGTIGDKISSLYSAYNALSIKQRLTALLVINDGDIFHPVNTQGAFFIGYVDSGSALQICYILSNGTGYLNSNGTTTPLTDITNGNVYSLYVSD